MDSNILVERIKDVGLLKADAPEVWQNLALEYPYFSIARWLKYGCDFFNKTESLKEVVLYKSSALEFAVFASKIKETQIMAPLFTTEQNQKETEIKNQLPNGEPQSFLNDKLKDKKLNAKPDQYIQPKDILELINELPNSSIFNKSNLLSEEIESENEIPSATHQIPSQKNNHFDLNATDDEDKSLMVVMSFTEWLNHFKQKTEIEKKEVKEKKALKAAWQKEKLAEAAEEESDEIPEPLFKQAMESISMESTLISEALAEILAKQGKHEKAISMYKKLSLRNPEKSAYFANLINDLNLNND